VTVSVLRGRRQTSVSSRTLQCPKATGYATDPRVRDPAARLRA
jgi:hypothetical protein